MENYSFIWLTEDIGLPWKIEASFPSDAVAITYGKHHLARLEAADCKGLAVWRHSSTTKGGAKEVAKLVKRISVETQ